MAKNGKNWEMIHRLLDGDLPAAEEETLRRQMDADPALQAEFERLARAVRAVRNEPRMAPPSDFTRAVMKRLPVRRGSYGERLRDFLLRGRTLRWNMATALAAAAALITATVVFMRQPVAPPGGAALSSRQEGASVIVRLTFYAPQARQVTVAGDFNRWKVDSHAMNRQNGGLWTIDLALEPGVYSYMFVLDGKTWVTDPGAESFEDDGFGNKNAVMRVIT
jgi:anti-sigma factor RsiW